MALTEEQREIALRVGRDVAQTMQLNEPDGFLEFAARFLSALPKPEPVGNLNNGKFFWNTKGGPDKWRDRQNYDGPLYAEAHITQTASEQRDAERYHFLRDSQEGKTIRIKPRLLWNEEIDAAIASVKGGE